MGMPIEIVTKNPKIIIPPKKWRNIMAENKGSELFFEIAIKTDTGRWDNFTVITNTIAPEPIDDFLVYRKIHPSHGGWKEIGIYQRNLRNYDESTVIENRLLDGACLNCHTFCNNRTDKMLVGIRSEKYGSSAIQTINGKTEKIGSKFTYTSWHPTGKLAVYSINKVHQFYHSHQSEVRDVIDLDSLLAYYSPGSATIKTVPQLSDKKQLETYPAWSPDGRYLYFCSAPMLWPEGFGGLPERYKEVKYDLIRISYDVETDSWGDRQTVLASDDTGLCILEPRISPNGRWLIFCMCDYSSFPVYQQSSDLYIMDLQAAEKTGRFDYKRLDINSDQSESWHSFSSNSRWLAFSSKRDYGVFTRTYFSYIDENGRAYKAFVLPQKDPTFYDSYLKTFSVPELVIEPVSVTGEDLARVIRGEEKIAVDLPITMATPKGNKPSEPWQGRE